MPQQRTAQLNDYSKIPLGTLDRHTLVETFQKAPAVNADILITSAAPTRAQMLAIRKANADFAIIGTNGTTALATLADGGGVTLTTAGASADQMILVTDSVAGTTAWRTNKWNTLDQCYYGTTITTGASIASMTFAAGLKLTMVAGATGLAVTTDADGVFFRYQDTVNGGKFQAVLNIANVDTTIDTGVLVAASTNYKLELFIDSARVPHFFINGDECAVTAGVLTTNIDLLPFQGVQADTAAAKAVTFRRLICSKAFSH